jgi:hypothetical protein
MPSQMSVVGFSEGITVEHGVVFPCSGAYDHLAGGNSKAERSEQSLLNRAWAGRNHRHITIEMIPDDVLLEIFDFYRLNAIQVARGRPWKWQCLVHVCRRWRYIVSNSPRRLDLRIIFKSMAPMKSILDLWPRVPIAIRYTRSQKPKPKVLNNLAVALRDSNRVCEIELGVTCSMLGLLVDSMQESFPILEHIRITSNTSNDRSPRPILGGTFLGGYAPRLRTMDLSGISIPFPALRRLLLSADDLDTLELYHIPNNAYDAEQLVTSLSAPARLRILSFHIRPPTSRLAPSSRSPPQARVTLPSLRDLKFHGDSEYLEALVSRMNLPVLHDFSITFYNQLIFEIPQLCQFIGLVDALSSPTKVIVEPHRGRVSITLIRRGARRGYLGAFNFDILCRQLDWQLSSAAQLFTQLTPILTSVRRLIIKQSSILPPIREENDVDSAQWLDLFAPFSGVLMVRVTEEFVADVVQDLGMATLGVLPSMTFLLLHGHRNSKSVQEAAELFVNARKRSGHKLTLYN